MPYQPHSHAPFISEAPPLQEACSLISLRLIKSRINEMTDATGWNTDHNNRFTIRKSLLPIKPFPIALARCLKLQITSKTLWQLETITHARQNKLLSCSPAAPVSSKALSQKNCTAKGVTDSLIANTEAHKSNRRDLRVSNRIVYMSQNRDSPNPGERDRMRIDKSQ